MIPVEFKPHIRYLDYCNTFANKILQTDIIEKEFLFRTYSTTSIVEIDFQKKSWRKMMTFEVLYHNHPLSSTDEVISDYIDYKISNTLLR